MERMGTEEENSTNREEEKRESEDQRDVEEEENIIENILYEAINKIKLKNAAEHVGINKIYGTKQM